MTDITIKVEGPAAEPAGPVGPPENKCWNLNPPQVLQLPPSQMETAPTEGQAGRFVVEGKFTMVGPNSMAFEVERVYGVDYDVEADYGSMATEMKEEDQ